MKNSKHILTMFFLICMITTTPSVVAQSKARLIKPINEASRIKIIVNKKPRTYYSLFENKESILRLNGPGKLILYTRPHFANKNDNSGNYQISYTLNDGKEKTLTVKSVNPSSNAKYPKGVLGIPGSARKFEINIPIGTSQIKFKLIANNKPVAIRYIFKSVKLKLNWIDYTPRTYESVCDIITNEMISSYYKYSKKKPLEINVNGPTQIKVYTRLGFNYKMSGVVNFRLQILENGQTINTYQLSNKQSEVSIFKKEKDLTPGKASKFVINVPAGKHSYQIIPMEEINSGIFSKLMIVRGDVSNTE